MKNHDKHADDQLHSGQIPVKRRRFVEGMIRVIDLVVYATVTFGGVYALVATPTTVETELGQNSLLIYVWGALLIVGGSAGFAGRLTRRWMFETPATMLAMSGVLIYFVILGRVAFSSLTAAVAAAFTLVAAAVLFRRWSELQIFASSGKDGARAALSAAVRRKTTNFSRHS